MNDVLRFYDYKINLQLFSINRSRGFGFITYEKVAMLDECQANRPHKIDSREVETKRAMPREVNKFSYERCKNMLIEHQNRELL